MKDTICDKLGSNAPPMVWWWLHLPAVFFLYSPDISWGGGGSEARIFYVMKGALHSNSYLFIPTHVAKPHILLSISGNNWTLMQQEWSTTEKPGLWSTEYTSIFKWLQSESIMRYPYVYLMFSGSFVAL